MAGSLRLITAMLALAALAPWAAQAQAPATLPTLEAPPGARLEQVADDMVLNGQHARVARFDFTGTVDDVLGFYRQRFGARHVENHVGDDRAIATRQGEYFVTVRVHAVVSNEVQATLMAMHMGGTPSHSGAALDTQHLLPAGAALMQMQESNDGGVPECLVVAVSKASVQANRDALLTAFRARGFRLEKAGTRTVQGRELASMDFSSETEDAVVTVSDAGAYRTLTLQRSRKPS